LDQLADEEALQGYHHLQAARADLLRRDGRLAEAATAYQEALSLVQNVVERAYLTGRLAEIQAAL
jgi:RNA polymerase sigma-70 factor (ECF subfamily)